MQRRWPGTCINLVTYIDESTITGYMRDKIIDSSYSHHLSEYGALFPNLYQFKGNDAILTAYNSIHQIEMKVVVKGMRRDQMLVVFLLTGSTMFIV